MLLVVYGTDRNKTRQKVQALVADLGKRKPDAELFRLEADGFDAAHFENLVGAQGLFEQKYIVVLDRVCGNTDYASRIEAHAPAMAESQSVFIVLEDKLTAGLKKVFEKHAKKVEVHDFRAKKDEFNVFGLTDAVGKRDKKCAWMLLQEARARNVEMQSIHGALLWQVRTMMQARDAKSAKEAGLKPYSYTKAQGFLKNYSEDELGVILEQLVDMIHESRKTKDLGIELERFVLGL